MNRYNFLGKETQVTTGYIDLQARFYDPTIGRFFSIDPETEGQLEFSPYHYSFNNPIRFSDPDGRFPDCCGGAVEGFADGVKEAFVRNVKAVTVNLPQTIQGLASLSSTGGQLEAAVGGTMLYQKTKSDWNTGDTRTRANIVGNVVGEIGIATLGAKGLGNLGKASRVANSVPGKLARVVPLEAGEIKTLGAPGSADVFVTAAKDIKGLGATEISEKLTIPASSSGFQIYEFATPQGIASPINRSNPGFVGGGRTAGGAREFVIPNQNIPKDAVKRKVE